MQYYWQVCMTHIKTDHQVGSERRYHPSHQQSSFLRFSSRQICTYPHIEFNIIYIRVRARGIDYMPTNVFGINNLIDAMRIRSGVTGYFIRPDILTREYFFLSIFYLTREY